MPHSRFICAAAAGAMFCAAHTLAQGDDATSSSGGATQPGSTTQVGAGALTDNTTTGTSGPKFGGKKALPQPLKPSFSIKPEGDPYWGPYRLQVRAKVERRCDVIEDGNARGRCEIGPSGSRREQ